ncbi:MAG TPA: GrpB family protein, partial [Flavisolibacter sp.]|nr:GrpB family protein [Flavisolibacter sp.]
MRIIIEPYNTNWPDLFAAEKERLTNALGQVVITIEHIGSTAVPGLDAKPIIDILVGVASEEVLDKAITPMIEAGYTYGKKYEPSWPTRRFFMQLQAVKDPLPSIIDINDNYIIGEDFISTVHIHVLVKDTYDWIRHMAFRDFLRENTAVRNEYSQ